MRDGRRAASLGLAGLLACGLLGTGCDTLDDVQRAGDPGNLASDLANRLDRTDGLRYTAIYQVSGGGEVSVAKAGEPTRVAYTYPGGKLIMAPDAVTACGVSGTAMNCTVTPVGSPDPGPDPTVLAGLSTHGMVAPPIVVNLLNAAALDPDAEVLQRDTTIAGQHATCVNVAGVDNTAAASFEVCVTTDGVLGSFAGVVNGDRIDMALTEYEGTVAADAFAPPANATLVHR